MDELLNLIVGSSTTVDVYVVVRLCIFCIALEFCAVIIGALGSTKRR